VAAIAGLAGSSFEDFSDCSPSQPVHTARIHGTFDQTIPYAGRDLPVVGYPGAIELSHQWLQASGCDAKVTMHQPLDLDALVPGSETVVAIADQGCLPGGSSELWTMVGSRHLPLITFTGFNRAVADYLFSRVKPPP
jgi:hypothetical protein